uniref:Uncharacterized protein n=1 Tax=Oryza nivara TaxID=4536 RepID=A0A0E0GDB3_ORYNI
MMVAAGPPNNESSGGDGNNEWQLRGVCNDGGLSTVVEATSSGDGKLISNGAFMSTTNCNGTTYFGSSWLDPPFLRPDLVTALTRVPWMAIQGGCPKQVNRGGKKGQRIGESEKRIRFRNHTGWRRGPWRGWVSRADHPELGARGSSLRLPPFRREPARRDRRQRVEGSALRPFGVDASGVRAASRTRGSGDGGRLLGWTVGPVEEWSPKKSRNMTII